MEKAYIKDLGLYLAELRHTSYEWGIWDCNTMVTRWIDRRHQLNTSDEIVGKYTDMRSAIQFVKQYKTASEYLTDVGYEQTTDNPRSGDIISQRHEGYWTGYIVLYGKAYSLMNSNGLMCVDCRNIANMTVWRYYD